MRTKIPWKILLGFALALIPIHCADDNVAGNTSETGNVRGRLVHEDGTPAPGVKVQFYPIGYAPSQASAKTTSFETETNQDGEFDLGLDSGLYNMVAETESAAAYAESIDASADANIMDTLKSFGSLTGKVLLQNNDDVRTVFVLLLGTNTWVVPDIGGKFTLSRLAEGAYNARILTTLDNYYPLDIRLSVTPGEDDTLGDPIVLPVKTLGTPTGLISTPLPGANVQLTWNPVGGAIVYEVYRSAADTTAFRLITKTLDTTIVDDDSTSTGTYFSYRVRATNGYVLSSLSDTVAALTTPAAPESVWAKAIGDSTILLTWREAPTASAYKILRAIGGWNPESIGITMDTAFTATGRDYREELRYTVMAVNASGNSPPSWPEASIPLGTILYSTPFYVLSDSSTDVNSSQPLTTLFDASGDDLGIRPGDVLFISTDDTTVGVVVVDSGGVTSSVKQVATIGDLVDRLATFLGGISAGSSVTLNANGGITFTAGEADIFYFQITSNRPGGSSGRISRAFALGVVVPSGASASTAGFCVKTWSPASPNDLIASLYNGSHNPVGGPIGLENGAIISVNGAVGGINITTGTYTYRPTASTFQDLFDAIRMAFALPLYDGTPDSNFSVSVSQGGNDIPAGAVVLRGRPGRDHEITNISVGAQDPEITNNATPTRFNANTGFIQVQNARD